MCMDGLQNAHVPSEMISISKKTNVLNHNFLLRKLKLLKETTRSQKMLDVATEWVAPFIQLGTWILSFSDFFWEENSMVSIR